MKRRACTNLDVLLEHVAQLLGVVRGQEGEDDDGRSKGARADLVRREDGVVVLEQRADLPLQRLCEGFVHLGLSCGFRMLSESVHGSCRSKAYLRDRYGVGGGGEDFELDQHFVDEVHPRSREPELADQHFQIPRECHHTTHT